MATAKLTNEKETLFIPLLGKAMDYRSKNSLLKDSKANEIIESIGIDIGYKNTFKARLSGQTLAIRAKQYDQWTQDFIEANPNALILHLGCGLDARITRVRPPDSVTWFDVDFPEVISLRKEYYSETNGYHMIACSITALTWLERIPANRPAFIIAEGVFEYLSKDDINRLLNRLTNHFFNGQIAFDVMSSYGIKVGSVNLKNTTGATDILKWSVDDLHDINRINPKLNRLEVVSRIKSVYNKQLHIGQRLVLGFIGLFPKYKNMMRLLRFGFKR